MRCRNCGIEIADKAIVCYRCGTATVEPKFKPPTAQQRAWTLARLMLIALAILIVADVVMWFAAEGAVRAIGWAVTVIVAVALLLVRYAGRRRNDRLRG
jgi:hypothetical protein